MNCGSGVQTRPLPTGSGSRELSPGPQLSGPRAAGPAPWTPTRSLWCRFSSSPGRPQKPGTPSPRLGRSGMAIPWDGAVPCDQTWPGQAGQRGTCQRADDIHTQPPLLTRRTADPSQDRPEGSVTLGDDGGSLENQRWGQRCHLPSRRATFPAEAAVRLSVSQTSREASGLEEAFEGCWPTCAPPSASP